MLVLGLLEGAGAVRERRATHRFVQVPSPQIAGNSSVSVPNAGASGAGLASVSEHRALGASVCNRRRQRSCFLVTSGVLERFTRC